eukprot:CAMPEP_0114601798 /NCGR_PEP_ID=MMETSP0125-20121206/24413_1 /TAXON_ID=485358 ORGANISM="Aristerostoma sp., Strain ATCC 50986" /NCGR_SAMPLE_ID=MMETSP0125 /ASSEMBLY_ACC=CAM_ASM_000245 /LENGTH=218 /DNA_ID=CAMNT_0001811379 /DNA_START=191 /DNA_END=848 /DNA_ORIENTATION=-
MALNKFADLSPAEFQQKMSCRGNSDDPTCPSDHNCTSIAKTSATSWDWTKKGAVTAIKNQGDVVPAGPSVPQEALKVDITSTCIILEKLYPYVGRDGTCKIPANATLLHVNTGIECIPPKDIEQMKAAVVLQPTTIAVDAISWQFYSSGIMKRFCGKGQDHNVLLVGFDEGEKYWKIKNSWGADWGEAGFIRVEMDEKNSGYGECGILRCGTRAVNKK